MGSLIQRLSKYINKYLSTKIVFLIDMSLSMIASLVALVLVNLFVQQDLLSFGSTAVWMGSSFIFSFLFIWILKTYRIIIRHTTLKDLFNFVFVAILKVLTAGMI